MNNRGTFEYLATREAIRVLEIWLDRLTRKNYDAQVNPMGLRLGDRRIVFPVVLSKPGTRTFTEPYQVRLSDQGSIQVQALEPELIGWSWHSDRIEPSPETFPAGSSRLARAISTLSRPFRKNE
jgi:hypothetical protein